jgi:glyoxylase-like metal-dependent hydrolase (beta-lactamase superfamily II)
MNYSLRAYPAGEQDLPGWCCLFGKNDTSLHRIVFYVWIAQAGRKTIVIDAGFPPDPSDFETLTSACEQLDPACALRMLSTLDQVFDSSGITPDSVDAVLITQPITYHTGGLLPRYFPRAGVYIPRAGLWEFLLDNPGHPPRDCYFTEKTWQFLRQLAIENRLYLPDGPTEVFGGLSIEPTGGHHPGSAAVTLQTSKGLLGILETAFLDLNITQEHPIGLAEDAAQTRRVIRDYKRRCNPLLAIHDNGILERFPGGIIA